MKMDENPRPRDAAIIHSPTAGAGSDGVPSDWYRRRSAWLRLFGGLALAGAVALMIIPTSFEEIGFRMTGRSPCGVPLQALFGTPNDACTQAATTRIFLSSVVAAVGVITFAFSGIRRPLRFVGVILIGGSVYAMLLETYTEWLSFSGDTYYCGTAIADLVRRGYDGIVIAENTTQLDPACGVMALNRFRVSVAVAVVGVALIAVSAIRNRARETQS
ncbi:MAG: hypothetical protein WD942_05605 [Dehalococcoidia bacterium]